jgi:hypothetical protein
MKKILILVIIVLFTTSTMWYGQYNKKLSDDLKYTTKWIEKVKVVATEADGNAFGDLEVNITRVLKAKIKLRNMLEESNKGLSWNIFDSAEIKELDAEIKVLIKLAMYLHNNAKNVDSSNSFWC